MVDEQIKEGSVVTLAGGDLKMTVDSIVTGGHANCVWHDGKDAKIFTYKLTSLKLWKPQGPVGMVVG